MNGTLLADRLDEVLADVHRLRQRFAHTARRAWDPTTAAAELCVQVGHLAMCLLRRNGADVSTLDDPARPITDIGDELADVVLASLSISVLAESEPAEVSTQPSASNEVEALLRLLVAAGNLSEASLVDHQYRHRPTGTPPALQEAAAALIGSCEQLAGQLGLDLLTEFRSMVADADAFLDKRGDGL